MFWLTLALLAGFLMGVFLLKVVLVKIALQASLAYNAILGRDIRANYQQVNVMIPDWVKTLAENSIYQRYSIDPPRLVDYPAFYRDGFKFFDVDGYEYAISYDGTGKYTVYRKSISEISGNKTKSVIKEKSKTRHELT